MIHVLSGNSSTQPKGLNSLQDAKGGLQGILTSLIEGKELDYVKGTLSPGDRSSKSNTQLANSTFATAILLRLGSASIQPCPSTTIQLHLSSKISIENSLKRSSRCGLYVQALNEQKLNRRTCGLMTTRLQTLTSSLARDKSW